MIKKQNKKAVSVLAFCLIAITVTIISFAIADNNIKLSLNGMHLVKNGEHTQAFMNITVKNVNANAVMFCLQYDECLELSDALTGEPIQANTSLQNTYDGLEYFVQDEENFGAIEMPGGRIRDPFVSIPGFKGQAEFSNRYLYMCFVPDVNEDEDPANPSDRIQIRYINGEAYGEIHANHPKGLDIGKVSFTVKNPAEFAKKTQEEINNLVKIVKFETLDMYGVFPEMEEDSGVCIAYLDEKDDQKFYYLGETEIKIETDIYDISANVSELNVSALDIYKTGSQQDLIDYLNAYASELTIKYTDESEVPISFVWDSNDETFSCSQEWNVKGGKYTVTQKEGDFDVTVEVNVQPVTIESFSADDEIITYAADSEEFPAEIEDLCLPQSVNVALTPFSAVNGLQSLPIQYYMFQNNAEALDGMPQEFTDKTPGEYVFKGFLGSVDFEKIAPWLTPPDLITPIEIKRNIVATSAELPKKPIVEAQTTDDGSLVITVRYEDGEIAEGTKFIVKMQNGQKLDTEKLGENYTLSFGDGAATITISPDSGDEDQKMIAQQINLGNRLGNYSISAQEKDADTGEYKLQSEFVKFSSNPRKNSYEESRTFDFSNLLSLDFPVAADGVLSETITLPGKRTVKTTYNGYDGSVPGGLSTVTVNSWDVTDNGDGVYTAVGTMLSTEYSGYGMVDNSENNHTITIIYKTNPDISIEDEEIRDIPDFKFDTQQVGYDYDRIQKAEFEIENIGIRTINGLSVTIKPVEENAENGFELTLPPSAILDSNKRTSFTISTRKGLEVGKYKATVSISSNQKILDTFEIEFNVINEKVFKITFETDNNKLGSAKTKSGQNTAELNEEVTIIATPKEECKFIGWSAKKEDNSDFPIENKAEASFAMPDSDLTITPIFEETDLAYLRLSDLMVKNPDLKNNALNNSEWKQIQFDPIKKEYFVWVPPDADTNSLWFVLREECEDAKVEVTHTKGTEVDIIDYSVDEKTYKTDSFELKDSPTDNLLTITLSKVGDDGEVLTDDGGDALEKSYIIHIRKKRTKDKMIEFRYGNSPYGLIMEDTKIQDKEKAKEEFNKKNRFAQGYIPDGGNPNIKYTTEAWQYSNNYDRDEFALFVINRTGFFDPGWDKITNSIGDPVNLDDVLRSITYKKMTLNSDWGTEEDFDTTEEKTLTIPNDENRTEKEINDLVDIRIKPDVYNIKYTFKDYNGQYIDLVRPIIILPQLGDVNLDRSVDNTDAQRINDRFEKIIPYGITETYKTGKLLYRYRVCDVNKDRNINSIDENTIRSNQVTEFYINKGGGE